MSLMKRSRGSFAGRRFRTAGLYHELKMKIFQIIQNYRLSRHTFMSNVLAQKVVRSMVVVAEIVGLRQGGLWGGVVGGKFRNIAH